jgi:thiamine pyrophosphokinase
MGDPVTMGVMAVGSAGSLLQQTMNAKQAKEYQQAYNDQLTKATIENYKQLDKAEADIAYNSAQDNIDNQIAHLENAAKMQAFNSAVGVKGGSVDMLVENLNRGYLSSENDIDMLREQQLESINSQAREMQNRTQASYMNEPIQRPSIFKAASDGFALGSMVSDVSGALDKYKESRSINNQTRSSGKVGSGGINGVS